LRPTYLKEAEHSEESIMSIDVLLSRLERVRKTSPGHWTARCPAHEDKSPSLAVSLADDGVVLMHCFSGCSVFAISDAIGLQLSDLFPPRDSSRGPASRRDRPSISMSDLVDRLRQAATVLMLYAEDRENGSLPSHSDNACVRAAALEIHEVLNHVKP
jgi:hypothetical protein